MYFQKTYVACCITCMMQDDTSILLAKGMHFETGPRGPSELSSIDGPLWVLAHLTEPLKLVGGPGPPL